VTPLYGKLSRKIASSRWLPTERAVELQQYLVAHAHDFSFGKKQEEFQVVAADPLSLDALRIISSSQLHDVVSRRVGSHGEPGAEVLDSSTGSVLPIDNHAAFVVAKLRTKYPGNEDAGVGEFILRWRQLFLSSLTPRFLPKGWNSLDGIVLL
jgi:hypothetical protein